MEDGTDVPKFIEMKIHQRVSGHHTFELRCNLSAIESESEPLINKSKDYFGKVLKVGYASADNNQPAQYFFKGIITEISVDKFQSIGGDLIMKGYSPTILLEEGRSYGTFVDKTLSDTVKQIMQGVPSNLLSADCSPDQDVNTTYSVQYKESSFRYLKRLAKAYNQWLYFDGTKLYFGKKKDDESFDLKFGSDVTNMKLDYKLSPSRFEVLNYNPQSDTIFSGDSTKVNASKIDDMSDMLQSKSVDVFNKQMQMTVAFHPAQQSDMDAVTTLAKNRLGSQYIVLNATCNNPHVKIGSPISISGPNRADPSKSDDFGKYRIVALEQTVKGDGNFASTFEAISSGALTPPYDIEPPHMAVEDEFATVKDNKDPNKMGMIRVQHIWQTGNDMSPWLDTQQVYAGSNRGSYFIPEIGDMVIVGFVNGDPSYPYVKGTVHRKDNVPVGGLYQDDNSAKAIALSENMMIHFNTKKAIFGPASEMIAITSYDQNNSTTPNPNYIFVTKDSQYGVVIHSENNTISITGDTINIESTNNAITIKSGAALNISAGGDITLDAGQNNLQLKGMNVNITASQNIDAEAQMQATLKGSTQLTLDGGAMVGVTGGIIKLN